MKTKIVIIEDEEALQKSLAEILRQENYEVITASNGEEGLLEIKKNIPDLVVMDLILPKKDGFEVLHELKSNENTQEIPVIVFTNLDTTRDIERVLEAGATTYLVKANYEPKDVIAKIKALLD